MPVIPATQEADAGESLEPRRQRLQRAEIVLLHSSLGDRVRLCLKKKKKREREIYLEQESNVFLVETGFCHGGQAYLELLTSGNPPALASQSAGITGMNHHARRILTF